LPTDSNIARELPRRPFHDVTLIPIKPTAQSARQAAAFTRKVH
jgi:hypothetical protein